LQLRGDAKLLSLRVLGHQIVKDRHRSFTWIKADFHLHTAEDPYDEVNYTALELLDHAKGLGFQALAVTLHNKVFEDERAFVRAQELGLLLIPAAELRIEGSDVVLLNVSAEEADDLYSFDDLRRLRRQRGDSLLVFAPHPFYRIGGSIGEKIYQCLDCFDAIEYCHFHIPLLNLNAPAVRLAEQQGKPLLATSDAHRRQFFGQNYSLIGIEKEEPLRIEAVFSGIRAGRIQRVSPTGGLSRFMALMFFLFCLHPILKRLPNAKQRRKKNRARLSKAREKHPASA
jgi:predicted metal-dependent phosphoesterase TrpH